MKNHTGKWALVTGASSGLGIEFAHLLAERKFNLVLAARRTAPMEELASVLTSKYGITVSIEGIDLSKPHAATELKRRLDVKDMNIDCLINNAGYGIYGSFLTQPREKTMEMIELNVGALTELSHVFGEGMANRGTGYILMLSSVVGFQACPGFASYAATKAYVLTFGEALREELRPKGVSVTVLSPGYTTTSFDEVAAMRPSPMLRMTAMKARPVAKIGINALFHGKATVVPGLMNKMSVLSMKFTPRALQAKIMKGMMANG